jgi:hypothetical protein
MRETILIAVRSHKQIDETIPALKNSVKAGTRVIFLLRCHISSFQLCLMSDVDALQPGASAALAERYYCFGAPAQLADHRKSVAREALSRQGIGVIIHAYTGSLRKAIKKYIARENVELVMTAKGVGPGAMRFPDWILRLIRFSKRRHMPPALSFRSKLAA